MKYLPSAAKIIIIIVNIIITMNVTGVVNVVGCVRLMSCLDCIFQGCDWIIHTNNPAVCTNNFRLSPFEITEVVQAGGVCPQLPDAGELMVFVGTPSWVTVLVGFSMFAAGVVGTYGFYRLMSHLRTKRGQAAVMEVVPLEVGGAYQNWHHNFEQRQLEQRIRGVAQLAGLDENDRNVRNAILEVDEELKWHPAPPGEMNRVEGNLLLDMQYQHEGDIVAFEDNVPPAPPTRQGGRR